MVLSSVLDLERLGAVRARNYARIVQDFLRLLGPRCGASRVFFEDATIHHHKEARIGGAGGGGVVDHTFLKPHGARAHGDRFVDDGPCFGGAPEHVDHVRRLGTVAQGRGRREFENFRNNRGYRKYTKALRKEISGHLVRGPSGVVGDSNDGNASTGFDQIQNGVDGGLLGVAHERILSAASEAGKAGALLENRPDAIFSAHAARFRFLGCRDRKGRRRPRADT